MSTPTLEQKKKSEGGCKTLLRGAREEGSFSLTPANGYGSILRGFAVISLYTLDCHCYLLLLCAWSLWSLLFPIEMRMVIIFPYACFVEKKTFLPCRRTLWCMPNRATQQPSSKFGSGKIDS